MRGETENQNGYYESNAAKAEDNRSSAYTLLIVGVLGIVVVVLGIFDLLPIHLYGSAKYMTYGVMSALFLLFIVMGVISMKSYHLFAKKAESEYSLQSTIEKWCLENLDSTAIDGTAAEESEMAEPESEEEKYFRRTGVIKEQIARQFMNLDDAFLDHFVDEIYADIFEET